MKKPKTSKAKWYFLLVVIISYLIVLVTNRNLFADSLKFFSNIFIQILPLFVIVFILMAISNFILTPKRITKFIGKKPKKRTWLIVAITGILSSGPIYMWYPLLADLKQKGMQPGMIGTFLYNRAIKLPFLPLILFYFSWQYVLTLTTLIFLASFVQGITLNKILSKK